LDIILKVESGLFANRESDSVLIIFNIKICLRVRI